MFFVLAANNIRINCSKQFDSHKNSKNKADAIYYSITKIYFNEINML